MGRGFFSTEWILLTKWVVYYKMGPTNDILYEGKSRQMLTVYIERFISHADKELKGDFPLDEGAHGAISRRIDPSWRTH